jgi:CheY-like chemotaxis protein
VVDDDVDLVAQMEVQLKASGYEVLPAYGQAEAEGVLARERVDLAVVDLMMEHADAGFALCHHIKKKDPAIPVIVVTAVLSETGLEFDAATAEERSWVKADAVLAKPVRYSQLHRKVEELLRSKTQNSK